MDNNKIKEDLKAVEMNTENESPEEKETKMKDEHLVRMDKLKLSHKNEMDDILARQTKIETTIEKFSEKIEKFTEAYQKEQEKYEKDIANLLKKRGELYNVQTAKTYEDFEKEKASIEKRIAKTRENKANQSKEYNQSILDLDKAFIELRRKQEKIKNDILTRKQNADVKFENQTKKLNAEKEKMKVQQQKKLNQIEKEKEHVIKENTQEEKEIDALKNELKGLYNGLQNAAAQCEDKTKEVGQLRVQLDAEFDNKKAEYLEETIQAREKNEALNTTLLVKQKELEGIKAQIDGINEKRQSVKDIIKYLKSEEEKSEYEIKEKIEAFDEDLLEKYEEVVKECKENEIETTISISKQLESLQYCLKSEEEQYNNEENLLKERFQDKEAEYRRVSDNLELDNKELSKKTAELVCEYNVRIADMKHEIEGIVANDNLIIESKEKELRDFIASTKKDYDNRRKAIETECDNVNANIEGVIDQIVAMKRDFEKYSREMENKKVDLKTKHVEEIDDIEKKCADINTKIQQVLLDIKEAKEANAISIANIEQLEKDIRADHEERVSCAKRDFECKLTRLEEINRVKIFDLNTTHDEKIKRLEDNLEKEKQAIVQKGEDLKNAHALAVSKIEDLEKNLTKEYEARTAKLLEQRTDLAHLIDKAKAHFDIELANYNKQKVDLESIHNDKLAKIKDNQNTQVAQIIKEYETLPNRELEEVKADYSIKLNQFDSVNKDINEKRNQIDASFNELVDKNNLIKEEAQKTLDEAQKNYDAKEQLKNKELNDLKNELDARKKEVEEFNERLNKDLAALKQAHDDEVSKLESSLLVQYNEAKALNKDKQDLAERQYNQEIDARNKEFEAKKLDFDNLIEDAKLRKDKMEADYKAKYAEEQAKTLALQNELDALNSEGEFKRIEWQRLLNVKKEENEREVEALKKSNENALEKMREDYDRYIRETNEKINVIKQDALRLDNEKRDMANNLNVYRDSKNIEIENIKNTVNAYIVDTKNKIADLAEKEAVLQTVHEERIRTLKKQIAATIVDFEELEKIRPSIIEGAVNQNKESFVYKAKEFKNKLVTLEKSNVEILEKLKSKRDQVLEQIGIEIEMLVNGRENALESHSQDIADLSSTYEALIHEELIKQNQLVEEFNKAKDTIEECERAYNAGEKSILGSANSDKESVLSAFANEKNMLRVEFGEDNNNAQAKIKSLENLKSSIASDIQLIKKQYDEVDKNILENKNELIQNYRYSLEELNRMYKVAMEEKKAKLKKTDVLKETIHDIFKR